MKRSETATPPAIPPAHISTHPAQGKLRGSRLNDQLPPCWLSEAGVEIPVSEESCHFHHAAFIDGSQLQQTTLSSCQRGSKTKNAVDDLNKRLERRADGTLSSIDATSDKADERDTWEKHPHRRMNPQPQQPVNWVQLMSPALSSRPVDRTNMDRDISTLHQQQRLKIVKSGARPPDDCLRVIDSGSSLFQYTASPVNDRNTSPTKENSTNVVTAPQQEDLLEDKLPHSLLPSSYRYRDQRLQLYGPDHGHHSRHHHDYHSRHHHDYHSRHRHHHHPHRSHHHQDRQNSRKQNAGVTESSLGVIPPIPVTSLAVRGRKLRQGFNRAIAKDTSSQAEGELTLRDAQGTYPIGFNRRNQQQSSSSSSDFHPQGSNRSGVTVEDSDLILVSGISEPVSQSETQYLYPTGAANASSKIMVRCNVFATGEALSKKQSPLRSPRRKSIIPRKAQAQDGGGFGRDLRRIERETKRKLQQLAAQSRAETNKRSEWTQQIEENEENHEIEDNEDNAPLANNADTNASVEREQSFNSRENDNNSNGRRSNRPNLINGNDLGEDGEEAVQECHSTRTLEPGLLELKDSQPNQVSSQSYDSITTPESHNKRMRTRDMDKEQKEVESLEESPSLPPLFDEELLSRSSRTKRPRTLLHVDVSRTVLETRTKSSLEEDRRPAFKKIRSGELDTKQPSIYHDVEELPLVDEDHEGGEDGEDAEDDEDDEDKDDDNDEDDGKHKEVNRATDCVGISMMTSSSGTEEPEPNPSTHNPRLSVMSFGQDEMSLEVMQLKFCSKLRDAFRKIAVVPDYSNQESIGTSRCPYLQEIFRDGTTWNHVQVQRPHSPILYARQDGGWKFRFDPLAFFELTGRHIIIMLVCLEETFAEKLKHYQDPTFKKRYGQEMQILLRFASMVFGRWFMHCGNKILSNPYKENIGIRVSDGLFKIPPKKGTGGRGRRSPFATIVKRKEELAKKLQKAWASALDLMRRYDLGLEVQEDGDQRKPKGEPGREESQQQSAEPRPEHHEWMSSLRTPSPSLPNVIPSMHHLSSPPSGSMLGDQKNQRAGSTPILIFEKIKQHQQHDLFHTPRLGTSPSYLVSSGLEESERDHPKASTDGNHKDREGLEPKMKSLMDKIVMQQSPSVLNRFDLNASKNIQQYTYDDAVQSEVNNFLIQAERRQRILRNEIRFYENEALLTVYFKAVNPALVAETLRILQKNEQRRRECQQQHLLSALDGGGINCSLSHRSSFYTTRDMESRTDHIVCLHCGNWIRRLESHEKKFRLSARRRGSIFYSASGGSTSMDGNLCLSRVNEINCRTKVTGLPDDLIEIQLPESSSEVASSISCFCNQCGEHFTYNPYTGAPRRGEAIERNANYYYNDDDCHQSSQEEHLNSNSGATGRRRRWSSLSMNLDDECLKMDDDVVLDGEMDGMNGTRAVNHNEALTDTRNEQLERVNPPTERSLGREAGGKARRSDLSIGKGDGDSTSAKWRCPSNEPPASLRLDSSSLNTEQHRMRFSMDNHHQAAVLPRKSQEAQQPHKQLQHRLAESLTSKPVFKHRRTIELYNRLKSHRTSKFKFSSNVGAGDETV